MTKTLNNILKNKKCFKLVCGAGNEDAEEVKKLVALYSTAGCNFFDLCAKPEIINSAKKGLEIAGIQDNRYLCVSVGIQGDPHVSKAKINRENCSKCGNCINICPQECINSDFLVNSARCIGCKKCSNLCVNNCIEYYSKAVDLNKVLPEIIQMGIDCIELHILGENQQEMNDKWKTINSLYGGMLSICADRAKFGNEKIVQQIKNMLEFRPHFSTIIQADGAPMSGGVDDYKTTLQAVAMAEIIQNENLPAYILLSGGTNTKTTELAKMCGVNANGVAIGSFARKIVKQYISRDDFLENKQIFNKALKIAENLVNVSLNNL